MLIQTKQTTDSYTCSKQLKETNLFVALLVYMIFGLTGAATTALIPGNAFAQVADHTKPINVKADQSVYNDKLGTQVLSGNVEVTQGSMSIYADSIEIEIKNGTLYRIKGTGNPIRFQQMSPDNQLIRGECNELVYNTETSNITFKGNANFERPGQELTGHTIEYNLSELTFKASGNQSGRVNITLQPGILNR